MQTLTFSVSLCSKGSHCWIVRNKNKNVHKSVLMISFTFLRNTWVRPLFTSEIDGHGLSSRYGKNFLKVVWAGKKKLHMVCSFSSRIKAWGLCYHVSWEWRDSLQMCARLHVMDPWALPITSESPEQIAALPCLYLSWDPFLALHYILNKTVSDFSL